MRGIARLVALVALLLGIVAPAHASLFRYGNISWVPIGGTEVVFTVQTAWFLEPGICVDARTLAKKDCTGIDLTPNVGDVVRVRPQTNLGADIGFNFSPNEALAIPAYLVTFVDVPNKWFAALMFDPSTVQSSAEPNDILGATLIHHTYPATGAPFTASLGSCCRIGNGDADKPNVHVNNPGRSWKVLSVVDPAARPIALAVPPIVLCPQNASCDFGVAAAAPSGAVPAFSLSTADAAGDARFVQPTADNGVATIDPASGAYAWDTAGVAVNAGLNTLYSTQVTETDPPSSGAVDFMLNVVNTVETSFPVFNPGCSRVEPVIAGQEHVIAVGTPSDASITVQPLPVGASAPVVTPVDGGTVATITWTPTEEQLGVTPLLFVATAGQRQGYCSVMVAVVTCTDDASCPGASGCNRPACVAGRCVNQPDNSLCDSPAPCTSRTCDASAPADSPDGCVAHEIATGGCCDNCLDDDADGITDLEDDDCCTTPVAQNPKKRPKLDHTLNRRRGKVRFNTRMELGLQGIIEAPEPMRFLLRKGPNLLMCTSVPKDQLFGFLDLGGTVELTSPTAPDPVGGQLDSVVMKKLDTNRIRVRAKGSAATERIKTKGKVGLTLGAGTSCVRAGKFDTQQ